MRRLLIFLPLLLFATARPASAQLANAYGWCQQGAQQVITSGLTSTTQVQASYPNCTVTVNIHGGGAATIFSTGSSTPLSNPFTANSNGQWQFYAANGEYDIALTGGGLPTTVTFSDVFISNVLSGGGGGTCVNCAIKWATADAVRYVSPSGNDTNDGLSWGTAKLTIYAAITSLPSGNVSTLTAGTGKIVLSSQTGGVSYGGPATNGGMWIMGSTDPNFATPPTGWLKVSGPLEIGCEAPEQQAAHGHSVMCQMNGGGSSDRLHPLVWISSNANIISFDHIYFQNFLGTYIKYGIDSNNVRTGSGGSSAFSLRDVGWNMGSCGAGKGPAVDIGSNSFWIWMRDITGSGCVAEIFTIANSPTGLSRSSGVVTVTTTATNDVAINDWVTIQNATDTTFNGSFQVTNVTGSTTFTYNQGGPTATSGTGQVVTAQASAISINPGNTGTGSGLVFVNNINLNNGGIRLQGGTGGGSLYVNNVSYEGDFSDPDMPVVLIPNGNSNPIYASVNTVQQSDLFTTGTNAVQFDGNIQSGTDELSVSNIAGNVSGVMSILGGQIINGVQNATPLRYGQAGLVAGRFIGGSDTGRRLFSPSTLVATNLAATNPSSWSYVLGAGTITTGQRAPDGTTGAASATSNVGQSAITFYNATTSISVGDIFVFGIWMRLTGSGSGFTYTQAVKFVLNANSNGAGDTCAGPVAGFSNPQAFAAFLPGLSNSFNDGQWVWASGICKVYSAPSSPGLQFDGLINNPSMTSFFYGPILLKFPSGTISDNEATEIANNLSAIPTNCPAQTACQMPGEQLSFPGSTQFMGLLTHADTANRTYTFPDTTGSVPLLNTANTWTAAQTLNVDGIFTETTAPSAASGSDICYGDSTAHAVKCSYNNGSFFNIPQTICSGQIALTTGAISSGTRATNTLSCTGLSTSTDSISCTFASDTNAVTGYAPNASGGLSLKTWISAGTINVDQVNNTSGSITPGAATINCKGIR